MFKRLLPLYLLLLSSVFAIVTIKPIDIGEKPLGYSGELSFSWKSNRGNSEIDTTDAGIYLQRDFNNSLYFVKSSYSYGEADGTKNIDKSFVHLRRIHKLSEHFDDEQFIQQQSNAFQDLTLRTLSGAGLRVHTGDPKTSGRLYFGFGAFYLIEKERSFPEETYARSSFYLSYKYAPRKDYTFALISYYQPHIERSSDYLQLSTMELNLAFNKSFSVKFSVEYNVNSLPVLGVKPYDYSQTTAFKYKF